MTVRCDRYLYRWQGDLRCRRSNIEQRVSKKRSIRVSMSSLIHVISLLDDIQRLNIDTLQWQYITTLPNPIAAWFACRTASMDNVATSFFLCFFRSFGRCFLVSGMAMDNDRIFLVFVRNMTRRLFYSMVSIILISAFVLSFISGGYDILHNQSFFLADCSIYNLSTRKYENTCQTRLVLSCLVSFLCLSLDLKCQWIYQVHVAVV
jgi:hypothetical protein